MEDVELEVGEDVEVVGLEAFEETAICEEVVICKGDVLFSFSESVEVDSKEELFILVMLFSLLQAAKQIDIIKTKITIKYKFFIFIINHFHRP